MASIGFPPPAAHLPILSETARPTALRPASLRPGGLVPGDRPERPERPEHPHRTDRPVRPERPDRPERPVDVFHRGRARLDNATRRFVHEAKAIIKNGGTMEDIEALAMKILETIPALEKFPPFQKILQRIANHLNNGVGPAPVDPTPLDPGGPEPAEAVASLTKPGAAAAGEPETTLPLAGVSIVV